MSETATQSAIEDLARNSYGRLIAFLASRSGDVAGAEDALSEAFVAALEKWPKDGVPERPEAWLLRVARNRLIHAARHNQVRQDSETFLQQFADEAQTVAEAGEHFPDERLKLLFVCAHPAIDPAARTPLMLQTVLGIDAARIASAFLVSPAAMSQRLVRAKSKIRSAAIPFRGREFRHTGDRPLAEAGQHVVEILSEIDIQAMLCGCSGPRSVPRCLPSGDRIHNPPGPLTYTLPRWSTFTPSIASSPGALVRSWNSSPLPRVPSTFTG